VKYYQDGVPYLISLCVGTGDFKRKYLRLVVCETIITDDIIDVNNNNTNSSSAPLVPPTQWNNDSPSNFTVAGVHLPSNTQLKFSVLTSGQYAVDNHNDLCLARADGENDSGSGALLTLVHCRSSIDTFILAATDEFILSNISSGLSNADLNDPLMVKSSHGDMCMTAGWPFLTAVAFHDPADDSVSVVVMNESNDPTAIMLSDTFRGDVWFGIPERSIQTIVY
jgi:hypothetical protein